MLKFNGESLWGLGNFLGVAQSLSECWLAEAGASRVTIRAPRFGGAPTITKVEKVPPSFRSIQQFWPGVAQYLNDVLADSQTLGFRSSERQARRIIEALNVGPMSLDDFARMAEQLRIRVSEELQDILLFQVPTQRLSLWNDPIPFGEWVDTKFRSCATDVREAVFCLSLDRWTGCVFHLMRVMETGVQALGDKLSVKLTAEKNWQVILDEVNKAIKQLPPKEESTKRFAATAAHLYNVKIAWRNEVMHPKASYTEVETEDIFRHVQTFMRDLADLV